VPSMRKTTTTLRVWCVTQRGSPDPRW
jgi:hypothetical protein